MVKYFIYSFLLTIISTFDVCQQIQLGDYMYDLTTIKSQSTIAAILDSSIIEISPCQHISCTSSSQKTFAIRKTNQYCEPYTDDHPPLKEYYQMISSSQPKDGLEIKYVPYLGQSDLEQNTNNQTGALISQASEVLYETKLKIYCNAEKQEKTKCTHSNTVVEEKDRLNKTLTITTQYLVCELYLSAGCPQLAKNHFWKFLDKISVILAIFIWISAIFILLFGYVTIRMTILMTGIYTGGFLGIIFSAENYENFFMEQTSIFIFVIVLSVVMGVLLGIFLLTVPKLGYLNIGLWSALVFSLLLQNSVLYLTASQLAFFITFGVVGFIMAIVSQMQFGWFIIFCTSFIGAFWIIRPLGFFLPHFPNQFTSSDNMLIGYYTPWQFYLYLISIIILTVLGIAFQLCLLKKLGYRKGRNNGYYLETDGPIKEKIKKIFQFEEIKDLFRQGKQEIVQLKRLIADERNQMDQDSYVEMRDLEEEGKDTKKKSLQKVKKKKKQNSDSDPQNYLDSVRDSNHRD